MWNEVDAIVENDLPLIEVVPAQPKPEAEAIGHIIAEMVPDGATLQLGIGGIPNAVCLHLESHKDLGVHTELFCPGRGIVRYMPDLKDKLSRWIGRP